MSDDDRYSRYPFGDKSECALIRIRAEKGKPTASELDVIFRIRRRIENILTSYVFGGSKSEHCITVTQKEAEVIRKHIGDTIHPDALKVSRPGFVCALAGVWVLEEQS